MKKNKTSKKPNILKNTSREHEKETTAMLSEFSDGYHDFYVDEITERKQRDRDERAARKESRKVKKPISPTRRKVVRIVSTAAIVTVVLVVGVILSLTVLFKTQSYEITGNSLYPEEDIIAACGIGEGENIFMAPKTPAERRIKDKFPYVEEVDVGFRIPDTIKIEITQAVEGYLVKLSDDEYLLVSTKGRILDRIADKDAYDLPIFIGPTLISGEIGDYVEYEDETVVAIIDSISEIFADNGYQGITEIDATNTASITFTYDGRIKVKLGIPEDLSYKIRTAMTIITNNIDINPNSAIEGILDVSRCNETKRSYFDERELVDINATEAPTEADENSDDYVDGWYDEYGNFYPYEDTEDETEAPTVHLSQEEWYVN